MGMSGELEMLKLRLVWKKGIKVGCDGNNNCCSPRDRREGALDSFPRSTITTLNKTTARRTKIYYSTLHKDPMENSAADEACASHCLVPFVSNFCFRRDVQQSPKAQQSHSYHNLSREVYPPFFMSARTRKEEILNYFGSVILIPIAITIKRQRCDRTRQYGPDSTRVY